jgi:tRNA(Ile)-lysidine synthase TilS/MesJ
MAARDLRYQWLEDIRKATGFDFIATAHHMDDSIETLLLNLTNGCGIRGLHGIVAKNDETKIILTLYLLIVAFYYQNEKEPSAKFSN